MRRRWWVLIGVAVAIPVLAYASLVVPRLVGVVTVEAGVPVFWRDYPGVPGVDALAAPTAEQALADGEAMVAEMRDALGLAWADDDRGEYFFPTENGYGSWSVLVTVNAPTWQSTGPAPSDEQVVGIIGEVAQRHGFSAPQLHDDAGFSGVVEGPHGQWVFFGGDETSGAVMLSYGANALLPSADRAEFERRLAPFAGLSLPVPLED